MGCVYLVTNKINGKQYVGKTKHTLLRRRKEHERGALKNGNCVLFYRALMKYEFENFEWEELYSNVDSEEELNRLEIESIAWFGTRRNGYNLTEGGGGMTNPSPETVLLLSNASKKWHSNLENRKKHSDACKASASNSDFRKNVSIGLKKTLSNPVIKERQRKTNKEIANRPYIVDIHKECLSRPDVIKRRSESIKKAYTNFDVKIRHHNALVEAQNRPEVIAKKKLYWAKRKQLKLKESCDES